MAASEDTCLSVAAFSLYNRMQRLNAVIRDQRSKKQESCSAVTYVCNVTLQRKYK